MKTRLAPIIIKVIMLTAMVTLAMVLIYDGEPFAGYVIYGKEVLEFILFICFISKRRKNDNV